MVSYKGGVRCLLTQFFFQPISTFKWNGYGYEDTAFSINDDGVMQFRGKLQHDCILLC